MATKEELVKQKANLNSQKRQLSNSFNVARGRVENLKKASGRLKRAKEDAEGILTRIKIMHVGSDWQGKRANEFRAAIASGGRAHNAGSDYLRGIMQAKEAVDAALRIAENDQDALEGKIGSIDGRLVEIQNSLASGKYEDK